MALKEVKIEDLTFNPFTKIGKEWMLITAGNEEKHNTMTASWGGCIYPSSEIHERICGCRGYVYTFLL